MYYSAIGLLAVIILLIENRDILLNRSGAFELPAWKVYRKFLFAVLVYYITDILWGILESRRLAAALFADTTIYFVAMAVGVLFWAQYTVAYLDKKGGFGRILILVSRLIAGLITLLAVVNIFVPMLFTVGEGCVYRALPARYVMLVAQILLFLNTSIYAFSLSIRQKVAQEKRERYRTLGFFGLIMAVFLTVQIWFPYIPLYSIAYMLGTCLLHAFVVNAETGEIRQKLEENEKIKELRDCIASMLDNMPAMSFSKDAETGVYMACNQAFAEYAHKDGPEGVIGLTDSEIFNTVTAEHFVEDDRMALSMDKPYIFYEDVPDAEGNRRQLQTTKLKFIDLSGRLCILGMCSDVTEMVRIQREHATTKEAYEKARSTGIIYNHIAQALARGYTDLYYVNMDTDEFIEYHTEDDFGVLTEARRGSDFFEGCERDAKLYVHEEDQAAFVRAMNREFLEKALDRDRVFAMTYRRIKGGDPFYVMMRASRMEDDDRFIVLGVTDIDEQMKQRRMQERIKEERTVYERLRALMGNYICIYVVDPETNRYREFAASNDYVEIFAQAKEGVNFFDTVRDAAYDFNYPEDLDRFLTVFTKENVMAAVEGRGVFSLGYRLLMDGRPVHVQLKAAMIHEQEGPQLIVGISDVDAQVRQEETYSRQLAVAQKKASVDALTGVKNRHAYLDAEALLDRQIKEKSVPPFSVVILDVNDLKKINDAHGHQAGDQYLRDACRIVCNNFKHSPVYRVGGDEFAVIAQGSDYEHIDELIGKMSEHNEAARRAAGVVIACGMARFDNDESVAPVFERADQNMYENKSRLKENNN